MRLFSPFSSIHDGAKPKFGHAGSRRLLLEGQRPDLIWSLGFGKLVNRRRTLVRGVPRLTTSSPRSIGFPTSRFLPRGSFMFQLLAHVTENESLSMVVVYLLGVATGSGVTWFASQRLFRRVR